MSLGAEIIAEIGRRRQMGMYFDYAAYQALRRVDDGRALTKFFRMRGLARIPETTDPKRVVDWLQVEADAGNDLFFHVAVASGINPWGWLFGGVICAMSWIARALRRKALIAAEEEEGVRTRSDWRSAARR